MQKYNRGGKTLCVGNIGKMKVLRQHILLPGERLKPSVKGHVKLSGLRQQTSIYLNAQIEAFATPVRWLDTNFPAYITEGVSTAQTLATMTAPVSEQDQNAVSQLGLGHVNKAFWKVFIQAPIKIHNEWFRWHEDAKRSVTTPTYAMYADHGMTCVNLPSAATRIHAVPTIHADESDVPSATIMDVRTMVQYQARFEQAAKTDWEGADRYNVFHQDIYGAKGNNEVDQIPTRLAKGNSISVHPRDFYASDGASLGEIMSINNFNLDHEWRNYVAPEHMVITYVLLLRFSPVLQDGLAPGVYVSETPYSYYQGDPNIIAAKAPELIAAMEIAAEGDTTTIGTLAAGWQYREGHNHIDKQIRDTTQFPLLDGQTISAAGYRDASQINESAFRSIALRHWFADLDFNIQVHSRIAPAGASIVAGSGKSDGPKGNHPTGGYLV